MQKSDLITYYNQGFFVGPNEDESNFLKRAEKVKEITKAPLKLLEILKVKESDLINLGENLLCFESSQSLPFWYGAITLMVEVEEGITFPVIQIPKRKWIFKLIDKEDLFAHEKIHAKRAAFDEETFEEIIAYKTSSSRWRRYWGPLFPKKIDSLNFLCILGLSILALSFWPNFAFYPYTAITLTIIYYVSRLIWKQAKYKKALAKLEKQFKHPEKVLEVLTDKEILLLAKKNRALIEDTSLRWNQIRAVFETKLPLHNQSKPD